VECALSLAKYAPVGLLTIFRVIFGGQIKRKLFGVENRLHNSIEKASVAKIIETRANLKLLFGFLFLHVYKC
jgi:hypothetical protein